MNSEFHAERSTGGSRNMVFRNFRFQVIGRVLVLALGLAILMWCLFEGYYLRSAYVGFAVVVLIIEFIRYADRMNHEVKAFLLSISQHDFTSVFPDKGKGNSFNQVHQALNHITGLFREISSQKEIQHRYLEMLVEHVRVGILSFTEDENIHIANGAVKQMLSRKVLGNLKALESIDSHLLTTIREIRSGETRLVNVAVDREILNLSIHASEFRLDTTYYKLISLQDIRKELDVREVESWQKLIRVLTHEIMNSIAPISSLSETLHTLVIRNEARMIADLYEPLEKGLNAIKIRSEGLHGFTEAYRRLTRLPQPKFQQVDLLNIINRVVALLKSDLDKQRITLSVLGDSEPANVDPELIEPVLINIIQNAIDALNKTPYPKISIYLKRKSENMLLEIADNGPGISPEIIDKIFIPFFTTKTGGSGIGLALSKQIIQLHSGYIRVASAPGAGTVFSITLPQ